jgi:hypothetical protein
VAYSCKRYHQTTVYTRECIRILCANVVALVILFWYIWLEVVQISASGDAAGVRHLPDCCQQTIDSLRDDSEGC